MKMRNGLMLYTVELRKILAKKSVWVSMVIGLLIVLLAGLTNFSADGSGVNINQQEEALTALSGEEVNQEFFDGFIEEMNAEINANPDTYEGLLAYQPGQAYFNAARAIHKKDLFNFIFNVVRSADKVPTVTEESFYEAMRDNIIQDGISLGATTEELDSWLTTYDSVDKPIQYSYALAYSNILEILFIIGWVVFLCISIALSGVFADEKTYRTDAMILSSRNGRTPVCISKLLAGITVAWLETFVLIGAAVGSMLFVYGTCGWNASIQNVIPSAAWNITIGDMMLMYFALALITSTLYAVTNMLFSHITHSAVATMAIHAAFLFSALLNIPSTGSGALHVISKYWEMRPTMVLYYGTFCNTYMYGSLNNVQVSLIVYSAVPLILCFAVLLLYKKSQVESR